MRAVPLILAICLLVPSAEVSAQLVPGQRVRVCAPEFGIDRQVGFVHTDSILVNLGNRGVRLAIPLSTVTRLDVIRARKPTTLKGMAYGSYAGAGIGVATGSILCAVEGCGELTAVVVAMSSAIGTGAGLVIGGVAGALIRSERWEEVPLDRLRVRFAPRRDGFALGLSVSF